MKNELCPPIRLDDLVLSELHTLQLSGEDIDAELLDELSYQLNNENDQKRLS